MKWQHETWILWPDQVTYLAGLEVYTIACIWSKQNRTRHCGAGDGSQRAHADNLAAMLPESLGFEEVPAKEVRTKRGRARRNSRATSGHEPSTSNTMNNARAPLNAKPNTREPPSSRGSQPYKDSNARIMMVRHALKQKSGIKPEVSQPQLARSTRICKVLRVKDTVQSPMSEECS